MLRFIGQRLLQMVPVLLGVSLVIFVLVRMIPGDPAQILLGQTATPETVAQVRRQLGLDKPIPLQYALYVKGAAQGNLGNSILTGRPVIIELRERLPATIELTVSAMLVAILVGVPVGVIAAVKQYSMMDRITSVLALTGVSMPIFWLAMIFIVIFGVRLQWLPFPGRIIVPVEDITGLILVDSLLTLNWEAFWDGCRHLVMPALALGTIPMAVITRMTRSSVLEVLGEDYIRTAHAKGLRRKTVLTHHAFRNALLPVITVIGLQFGILLGGAVITETIFAWPGIGQIAYESIYRRDYAMIQAVVLYGAAVFVLVNLIVDILYAVVDPRVRY
ncbi:MAG: ABC transporter permease [Chloroflexota bacterium]|nr:ABC transporter permease [Chloroflexota bacterium]